MKIRKPPLIFQTQLLPISVIAHFHSTIEPSVLQSTRGCGCSLNYNDYGRLIQFCTDRRLHYQGKQVHARLVMLSVTPSNFIASKLLTFYAKNGNVDLARKVFDRIPFKNTFSYNGMLIAYSQHERPMETLTLFTSLVKEPSDVAKPDHFALSCLLKALSGLSIGAGLGKEIHCYALRNCLDSDIFVLNALITCYSRCNEMDLARMVFDSVDGKDRVTWNSMISGYSQGGYYEDCLKLYRLMLDLADGLSPDGLTVISVLQACSQLQDLATGMEVHRYIVEKDIKIDIALCNSLVGLYAKCGSLDYAKEIFEEVSQKDEITYGSLITGYMLHDNVDKAVNLFRRMKCPALSTWNGLISGLVQNNRHDTALEMYREMLGSGLKPNYVTLTSILPILSCFSHLRGAKQVHCYAIRNYFGQNNIYIATAIIDAYGKSGFLQGARQVFGLSDQKSVVLWTAIIAAYSAHGDADKTLSLFDDMLKNGTEPDPVTFTAVLSACAHSGFVDEARRIFNIMQKKYAIKPTAEHYACMVGALSRAGKLLEATKFICTMPIEPSPKAWGALLNGASVFGNVEVGKLACSHLFDIEPENTGNYIIMANLYSRARRWEEAERVRQMMSGAGVKKLAGSSWIETSKGFQCFVARDASNLSDKSKICETLQGLLLSMEDEGYILQMVDDEG